MRAGVYKECEGSNPRLKKGMQGKQTTGATYICNVDNILYHFLDGAHTQLEVCSHTGCAPTIHSTRTGRKHINNLGEIRRAVQ